MDQPTESILAHHPPSRHDDSWLARPEWRCLSQGAMWTVHVVVIGELGIPITEHEPEPTDARSRLIARFRACCATYSPTGWASPRAPGPGGSRPRSQTARTAAAARPCLRCRKSTASTWRPELVGTAASRPPTAWAPGRRRRAAGSSIGAGADLVVVAEAEQLAVDPPVAPGRVLGCQPEHQRARSSVARTGRPPPRRHAQSRTATWRTGGGKGRPGADELRAPARVGTAAVAASDRATGGEQWAAERQHDRTPQIAMRCS